MGGKHSKHSRFIFHGIAAIALIFGLATISSGGQVLFGGAAAREAAGNYLPFVAWFNFIAGFAYVTAAIGLFAAQPWAARLAWVIAVATAVVFMVFAILALTGTPFETRTVGAMALRTAVWGTIAWLARHFQEHQKKNRA